MLRSSSFPCSTTTSPSSRRGGCCCFAAPADVGIQPAHAVGPQQRAAGRRSSFARWCCCRDPVRWPKSSSSGPATGSRCCTCSMFREHPRAQRQAMVKYVNEDIREHRNDEREDRSGVIVFGRDAAIEHPPYDDDIALPRRSKAASKPISRISRARSSCASRAARRLGRAHRDHLRRQREPGDCARAGAAAGRGGRWDRRRPCALSAARRSRRRTAGDPAMSTTGSRSICASCLTTPPSRARRDAADQGEAEDRAPHGRQGGGAARRKQSPSIPANRCCTLREEIDSPDFYTYEAVFTPDDRGRTPSREQPRHGVHQRPRPRAGAVDRRPRQTAASSTCSSIVCGSKNIQVTVRPTDEPIGSLAELQPFDTVILANVPREAFTDAQISMLVSNTRNMGAGLIMLGGENSFGAGGWTNTELEQAMPVDFQIKNAKVAPVGALAMVMHASEMADGNFWQAEDRTGRDQGPRPPGLLRHDSLERHRSAGCGQPRHGQSRREPQHDAGRDRSNDAGRHAEFRSRRCSWPLQGFKTVPDAAVKHMIIISDGDPGDPTPGVVQCAYQAKDQSLDRGRWHTWPADADAAVEHWRKRPAASSTCRRVPRRCRRFIRKKPAPFRGR